MKKTILFVLNESFARHGGMERFNRHMCMALQKYCDKYNFNCVIISRNDHTCDHNYVKANENLKFVGCRGSKFVFVLQYIKTLITIRGVEICIFGLLNHIPLAALIPRYIKKISIIHGFEAWEKLPGWKRFIISNFTEIWSVSEYTKKEFAAFNNISADRIKLLQNSLDYLWRESDEKTLRDEHFILCVTRLDSDHGSYKGVDNLLRAFSRVSTTYPEYCLTIVGVGTDVDRLRKLADIHGVANKVKFLGGVSDDHLKELYSDCTIFALPSKKEGFGIVFLEAMAARKPVIGGNHGGTPEVIENGETGFLVDHADEYSLALAISRLLASRELRIKMGNQGYTKLTKDFLYGKFESTLFLYLSKLMNTQGG